MYAAIFKLKNTVGIYGNTTLILGHLGYLAKALHHKVIYVLECVSWKFPAPPSPIVWDQTDWKSCKDRVPGARTRPTVSWVTIYLSWKAFQLFILKCHTWEQYETSRWSRDLVVGHKEGSLVHESLPLSCLFLIWDWPGSRVIPPCWF